MYVGLDAGGNPIGSALGSFCHYKKKSGVGDKVYNNFDEFSKDLTNECVKNPPRRGQLTYTPPADLVGKVLYYQVSNRSSYFFLLYV